MSDRHEPGTLIGIVRNPHRAKQVAEVVPSSVVVEIVDRYVVNFDPRMSQKLSEGVLPAAAFRYRQAEVPSSLRQV
jgi:hypothetical protein